MNTVYRINEIILAREASCFKASVFRNKVGARQWNSRYVCSRSLSESTCNWLFLVSFGPSYFLFQICLVNRLLVLLMPAAFYTGRCQ